MTETYKPACPARHRDLNIRGLRCRLHEWGPVDAEPVLLLHGWADTGMSFQFLADVMAGQWRLLAPDWRGFGDSDRCPGGYWFPDYLADLDSLLDQVLPGAPARLVGHSMGGNVAWLFAGVRSERVSHVASLDAFGPHDTQPSEAPARYRAWLDQLRDPAAFSCYDDLEALCQRVRSLAPMLSESRARFIAEQWGRAADNGTITLRHDPAHKHVNPVLYRRAEACACWKEISARTLMVLGSRSRFYKRYFEDGLRDVVRECLPDLQEVEVDAGHMLHMEAPEPLAAILDDFLRS